MPDQFAPSPDAIYWKRKLAAFLHDSPSKPLDIKSHEVRATGALRRAGLIDDEGLTAFFDKRADHTAAAADRVPFPHWSSGIRCSYDPEQNPLRHPLGADSALVRDDFRLTASGAETIEQTNQPILETGYPADSAEDWRSRFFAHWRLWRLAATEAHAGFAALPADTRVPDHTIWTHMGIVSALEGCNGQPALLKFQLGPVQEFIAASRSTRDLWSGSMLLSWLMAAGLARLAEIVGPDAVVFPNLWGQPLFDLRFRDTIWGKLKVNENAKSAWDQFNYPVDGSSKSPDSTKPLHTPNLPNVFLALVPAGRASEIAREVESAVRDEWKFICDAVLEFSEPLFNLKNSTVAPDSRKRFRDTSSRHLDVTWQTLALDGEIDQLLAQARQLLPHDSPETAPTENEAVRRLEVLLRYFTQHIPVEHRDSRYYVGGTNGPKTKLNNLGVAWSLAVALTGWQLDATRALRQFDGNPGSGHSGNSVASHGAKDALNGRDPMLFGGSQDWLKEVHQLSNHGGGKWGKLFRHTDEMGAITLIKRVWHIAYLQLTWGISPHPMPNTYELASGQPDCDDEEDITKKRESEGKYYAVIAFDGDSIGQWVSGAKAPEFGQQLSPFSPTSTAPSPRNYFATLDAKVDKADRLLSLPRPLSPSYHLQFSETLSNFALHCAPKIIAAYDGKLLYAGGDDVLAMVPAHYAFACADDLQRAFRGLSPSTDCGIVEICPGFLSVAHDHSDAKRKIPLILPGPRTSASVGITLAHFKQPLQEVVSNARHGEKRAKKLHQNKHAVGVTLLKRSGETIEWDTRFDVELGSNDLAHRGGILALQWMLCALGCHVGSLPNIPRPATAKVLSAKFPHRLCELLLPHIAPSPHGVDDLLGNQIDPVSLFKHELDHALTRQKGTEWDSKESEDTIKRLRSTMVEYVQNLPGETCTAKFAPVLNLLTTAAFLARQPRLKK